MNLEAKEIREIFEAADQSKSPDAAVLAVRVKARCRQRRMLYAKSTTVAIVAVVSILVVGSWYSIERPKQYISENAETYPGDTSQDFLKTGSVIKSNESLSELEMKLARAKRELTLLEATRDTQERILIGEVISRDRIELPKNWIVDF